MKWSLITYKPELFICILNLESCMEESHIMEQFHNNKHIIISLETKQLITDSIHALTP